MCQLKQPDPNAPMSEQSPVPMGEGPATDAIASAGATQTNPVAPAMKDTKLAKLLKIATPIVQGGLIGGFGGNWRVPGSGNAAAQNFFTTQAELGLQRQNQARQAAILASQEAYRKSQEDRNRAYMQHLMDMDKVAQERLDNPKPEADHVTEVSGYPGIGMHTSGAKAGTTFRLTQPVAPGEENDPMQATKYGLKSEVPLGPPESEKMEQIRHQQQEEDKSQPQAELVTEGDASGATSQHFVDKNPRSKTFGKTMSGQVGGRAKKTPTPSYNESVKAKADYAVQAFNGDVKKATAAVQASSLKSDEKALVIAEINKPKPGAGKLKIPDDVLKKMAQPEGVPASP